MILGLLISELSYPQRIEYPVNDLVVINYVDSVVYATILIHEKKVNPKLDRYYFWYKANDVKRTRGGFYGKLLHGPYRQFYPDKDLQKSGEFKHGLKKGIWKTWYKGGELESVIRWRNGRAVGHFVWYHPDGTILKKGKYRSGKLHGKVTSHPEKNITIVEHYKRGRLKKEKKKVGKLKVFEKRKQKTKRKKDKSDRKKKADKRKKETADDEKIKTTENSDEKEMNKKIRKKEKEERILPKKPVLPKK